MSCVYTPPEACPTLAGFTAWFYPITGVTTAQLPTDSPWLEYAFQVAMATVNRQLFRALAPIYMLAVYNLSADLVFQWAPDVQPVVPYQAANDQGPVLPYFAYWRQYWNLNGFVAGVINSSNDESTGQSMTVPKQYEAMTTSQLQNLKTPWGRAYIGFAQSVGSAWGFTR